MRRHTLRLDGFVSVHAGSKRGELVTKPVIFQGQSLVINFSTSAAGTVLVEIQDERGVSIPGYSLSDCPDIYGDEIERAVAWRSGPSLSRLAGKPVRLRFCLKDADLYSFQFR
ncbi:MAG: hypothetical protein ACUVV5_00820 [Candidatus Aminicenantales bacterium]